MLRTLRTTRSLPSLRQAASQLAQPAPPLPAFRAGAFGDVRTMATKRKAKATLEPELEPALLPKRRGRPKKQVLTTVHKRSSSTDAKPRQQAKSESVTEQAKNKATEASDKAKSQAEQVKKEAKEVAQDAKKTASEAAEKTVSKAESFANAAVEAIGKGPEQVKQVLESVEITGSSQKGKDQSKEQSKEQDYTSGEIPQNQKTGLLLAFGAVAAWFTFGGKLQRRKQDA